MVFLDLKIPGSGEQGALIANFDIGSAVIKPNLGMTIYWRNFLATISRNKSKWKIVGFADCQGSEGANARLRQHRADAVRRILPAGLQSSITATEAASPGNCITENTTAADRTMNRSAALILQESTVDMPPEEVRDSFERKEPDTEGCSSAARERLAVAYPLASRLAELAMALINSMERGSSQEALFKNFFGSNAFAERWRIKRGYMDALGALKASPTYKCVPQGKSPCEKASTDAYTGARAILLFGSPIVICDQGFADASNLELADTILHEASHAGAWTNDLDYCGASGCSLDTTDEVLPGIGLTDRGAVNNAASYARFASQAYLRGL
jgi:hypothetical protein